MAHSIKATTITFTHEALSTDVTLSQTPEQCIEEYAEADGTFGRFWPTSLALANYLCRNRELVAGKRVVELGAGSGAVGLVCAALGAASVTLTDVPEALPLTAKNAEQNPGLASAVRVAPCTWGDGGHISALLRENGEYDLVLCCEVIYQQSEEVLLALAATQRQLVRPGGHVLVGYEFRSAMSTDITFFDEATRFFGECDSHPLDSSVADTFMVRDDDGETDRFLYIYSSPARDGFAAEDRSGAVAWAKRCLRADGTMRCWMDMAELYSDSPDSKSMLWTVSLLLLHHLEVTSSTGYWVGKRVLELGAGAGHLAVGLSRLGAHVVATETGEIGDCYEQLQSWTARLLTERRLSGGEPGSISFRSLHWGLDDRPPADWSGFDVLILADAVYDEDCHEALLSTLVNTLAPGMLAYSAFVDRPYSLNFMALLDDEGSFDVEEVELSSRLGLRDDEIVYAHLITRKPVART